MASAFPAGLDSLSTSHAAGQPILASTDNDEADAINKIEATLGTNPQGTAATVGARIAAIESQKLFDSTLGSAAASFDITGIPASFALLNFYVFARSDNASLTTALALRFNGDSGSNYDWERSFADATASNASESLAGNSIFIGDMPAATATANLFSQTSGEVINYSGAVGEKTATGRCANKYQNVTTAALYLSFAGWWRSTAAINRLTFLPFPGNFVAGSRCVVYGLI